MSEPTKKSLPPIWNPVRVQWDFLTPLYASVPANPEVVQKWLESRKPSAQGPEDRSLDEITKEVFETLEQEDEVPETLRVFQRHPTDRTLVVRGATIRAHIKDGARVISAQYLGRITGERTFSTKVINGVYLDPKDYWIPILRPDGTCIKEPDGVQDMLIHARGPRGPVNALKSVEYLTAARLDFTLLLLGNSVRPKDLETVFTYGGVHGYGGERGTDGGRYTFHLHTGEEV